MDDETAEIELVCVNWWRFSRTLTELQLQQNLNKTRQLSKRMTSKAM